MLCEGEGSHCPPLTNFVPMFSSRNAVTGIDDVPVTWIFEYYLKLSQKLVGQNIMVNSVFNLSDTNPSMSVFVANATSEYRFYCHCTGMKGNAYDLVMHMFSMSFKDAMWKVVDDYRDYVKNNGTIVTELKPQEKWKVKSYTVRSWNKGDVDFWSPYNIGSKILDMYNVKPISQLALVRGDECIDTSMRAFTYGYLTGTGELYKVYQPYKQDQKFMTFKNYIQGWDQLKGKSRLFVCSSLKDIMSMRSLGIDGDYIAPQSENSGLDRIMNWILEYPEKYIIFDNDQAGIKMMEKYRQTFGIPYLHLKMAKDVSDSVKEFGASQVKAQLKSLLG